MGAQFDIPSLSSNNIFKDSFPLLILRVSTEIFFYHSCFGSKLYLKLGILTNIQAPLGICYLPHFQSTSCLVFLNALVNHSHSMVLAIVLLFFVVLCQKSWKQHSCGLKGTCQTIVFSLPKYLSCSFDHVSHKLIHLNTKTIAFTNLHPCMLRGQTMKSSFSTT